MTVIHWLWGRSFLCLIVSAALVTSTIFTKLITKCEDPNTKAKNPDNYADYFHGSALLTPTILLIQKM